MIRVDIDPSVMADMLRLRDIRPQDVATDEALLLHMEQTLPRYRVCESCAPTNLDAVRADLQRMHDGLPPLGRAA